MVYSNTKEWRKNWWKKYYKKHKKEIKARYEKNKMHIKKVHKKWMLNNKDKVKRFHKNYRLKYPEKTKAYDYFKNNNRKRERCQICSFKGKLYFHHIDYKKNLGITVCNKCHHKIHNKIIELKEKNKRELKIIMYALDSIYVNGNS